jgi:phage terminase large subunit GpA-like protein
MLIDSGYKPGEKERNPDNQIYSFCRRYRGRAFPTKGHDKQDRPVKASKIDVSHRGKIIKNGMDLWHVDTDYCKSWVYARLAWPEGEAGGFHLPVDIDDDYCLQLTAEARTVNASGRVQWVRVRRENHYLDVEALNVAAAYILRLHRLPKTGSDESATVADDAPTIAAETPPPPRRSPTFPRARQNFTTGWRR